MISRSSCRGCCSCHRCPLSPHRLSAPRCREILPLRLRCLLPVFPSSLIPMDCHREEVDDVVRPLPVCKIAHSLVQKVVGHVHKSSHQTQQRGSTGRHLSHQVKRCALITALPITAAAVGLLGAARHANWNDSGSPAEVDRVLASIVATGSEPEILLRLDTTGARAASAAERLRRHRANSKAPRVGRLHRCGRIPRFRRHRIGAAECRGHNSTRAEAEVVDGAGLRGAGAGGSRKASGRRGEE
mmetsp:Transcript_25403/g.74851  ORF Transcript_25403/g.74851 Transcript_25403/m.74851 type:complete len:243 (+) Transcript_25403:479-1207(+)